MAYIAKILADDETWHGPCPNKAGEFCGNTHESHLKVRSDGVIEAMRSLDFLDRTERRDWDECVPPHQRIGPPSASRIGNSEHMASLGYVGIYLIADNPKREGAVEVDTDELQEEVVTGQRPPAKPFVPDVPMREPYKIEESAV